MRKIANFVLIIFLTLNIVACGGGESGSSPQEKEIITKSITLAHATLGSLSKATVEIYEKSSNDLLYQGVTTKGDGKNVESAGLIKLSQDEFEKIQNRLFIIKIRGGEDIDSDDNNIWDENPIHNSGEIHAIVNSSTLDKEPFKINILTEVVYQDVKEKIKTLNNTQITMLLDEKSQNLLGKDINNDGKIDSKDLLKWNPIIDKKDLKIDYDKEIKPLLSKIHNNEDIQDFSQEILKIQPVVNKVNEKDKTEEEKRVQEEDQRKAQEKAAKKAQEEEQKKADEEARKKAQEEEQKRADEEARKKAQEEEQKRADEEARKKAQEEEQKRADEEARKKAQEEEQKKADEETRKENGEYDLSKYLYPQQNNIEISMDKMENNSSIFKYKNIYFKNDNNSTIQQPDYTLSQNIEYKIIDDTIEVNFNKNNTLQNSISLKKIIKIDEEITTSSSNCVLKSHQNTIKHNNIIYNDIIVIECEQNNIINSAFYAKDMGIIIQNQSTIEITNSSQDEQIDIKPL